MNISLVFSDGTPTITGLTLNDVCDFRLKNPDKTFTLVKDKKEYNNLRSVSADRTVQSILEKDMYILFEELSYSSGLSDSKLICNALSNFFKLNYGIVDRKNKPKEVECDCNRNVKAVLSPSLYKKFKETCYRYEISESKLIKTALIVLFDL